MHLQILAFSFLVFPFFVKAVEVSPDIGPKNITDNERDKQRQEFLENIPSELAPHPSKKDFEIHNKSLVGSNFTYGSYTSFDVDVNTQTSIDYKKSRFENVLEYYSYYFGSTDTPTRRFKGKFDAGVKYLYELYPSWSPFFGYKYEQTFERKGKERIPSEKHNFDLGLRYDYGFENLVYLMFELSHRYTLENSRDFEGSVHKLRGYAAVYYYKKPFGAGLWIEAVAPYSDFGDVWIEFGPDINYTFPGTSLFIGLTGDVSWQGQSQYEGNVRFNVWAANIYLGFKI